MVLYYTHEYVQVKKMRANLFSLAVKPAAGNLKLMESKICGNALMRSKHEVDF